MVAAGLFALVAVVTAPVRVVGDNGCLSGTEVEAALASMLTPSGPAAARPDVANLDRHADALHVELRDADGVVIAERTLDGRSPCPELARMAAIVIASWESDVHPEFVRPPADIARRVEPAPPARPPAGVPVASYDLAAGVSVGHVDTTAAGVSIGAAWFPRGVGFGLWGLAAGDMSRTISVGAHQALWRRWTVDFELAYRWTRRRLALDGHGGLTVGWMTTEGVDYAQNQSASTVSIGASAGIRLSWWNWRRLGLWLDLRGFYFPRQDSIYATSAGVTTDQAPVPGAGGVTSFGVAWGRAPLSP